MTTREFWRKIDWLASEKNTMAILPEFMNLLNQAYDENLEIIIACFYDKEHPGLAKQAYMDVDGSRFLVCYTSKAKAKSATHHGTWDIAGICDIMNNMFHKDVIAGLVFNPGREDMVIVLKSLMNMLMPGQKEKPPHFVDAKKNHEGTYYK